MPDPGRIVILGAGPTGLGAAYRLSETGFDNYVVLEARGGPGGLAASFRDDNGFTWDIGGHVQFSHYQYYDDVLDRALGDAWVWHERESWVWIRGRFVPYPFQLNIHRLDAADRDVALRGLEHVTSRSEEPPAANFAEWILATFGPGLADLFMYPYNRKVWGYPLEQLSADWIGERVARPDLARIQRNIVENRDDVSWGPNNLFRFPLRGGTGAIWTAVASLLPADTLRFGHRVSGVRLADRLLTLEDGRTVPFDTLISTLPLDVLTTLTSDLSAPARQAARGSSCASSGPPMREETGGVLFWSGCAATFVVVAIAVSWSSLGYYWNWDDLHLVRTYSSQELLGTLTGHWDPDHIESSGLRPMTTFFNHARAAAFGEQVLMHRLFLIALLTMYLVLLGRIAMRLGEARWAVLLAGILVITAKNSFYHFVWIADGVHVLQAMFFAGAAWLLLEHLDARGHWYGAGALALAALALGTREDSLATFPVMLLVGCFYANGVPARLRNFAICVIAIAVLFWMWRSAAIPGAAQFHLNAPAIIRFVTMVLWTVALAGQQAFPWIFVAVAAAAVAGLLALEVRDRRRATLWLLAALGTTVIGTVEARPNLLIFPVSFHALFLASVAVSLARQYRWMWMRASLALIMAWLIIVSARASAFEQLSMHPMSTDQIYRDWHFTYGPLGGATIPSQRRDVLEAKLSRLGVTDPNFDFDRWEDSIQRGSPSGDELFIPARRFMEP